MAGRLIVNADKCTGCMLCVDACSGAKAGRYDDSWAKIRVSEDEVKGERTPLVCIQCAEHFCAETCPAEAIVLDPDRGIYLLDEQACINCGECVDVCPYNGIFLGPESALKCDLCGGHPACAMVCVPAALIWDDSPANGKNGEGRYD